MPRAEFGGARCRVIDFETAANNDWLAVNQFSVTENRNTRRPDVVLFVNGLPLGVIELKNPADEDATIRTAWNQLQTYKSELPTLFAMNAGAGGLGRESRPVSERSPAGGSGSSPGAR